MKSLHAELTPSSGRLAPSEGQRARQMLMYEEPRLLDSATDRELCLQFDSDRFAFAQHSNSALLAASEFEAACADYPIVFVGNPQLGFSPAVVLGLESNRNGMLDAQYRWRLHTYVPAFIRRYPFVLMAQADGQLCMGIDAAFKGFGSTGGRLFEPDGQASALLNHARDFCSDFHQHMLQTRRFCALLSRLGLLVERFFEISAGPQTPPKTVSGFYAVDVLRLQQLPEDTLLSLTKGPELRWIHAHLFSLNRVNKLTQKPDPGKV
jgi:hypothetical protein